MKERTTHKIRYEKNVKKVKEIWVKKIKTKLPKYTNPHMFVQVHMYAQLKPANRFVINLTIFVVVAGKKRRENAWDTSPVLQRLIWNPRPNCPWSSL